MPRPLWSGAISFGLLNIPVTLISAKKGKEIHFNFLDKHDNARVGYKPYNKNTGEEISRTDIVKGYEYEPDHFVIMTDKDFERANPKATHSIEIQDFVRLEELDPLLFERPYYLLPGKGGEKGYALLAKILARLKRLAIGKIVLHQKQRLVAIMNRADFLVCEILRYDHELYTADRLKDIADVDFKQVPISKREMEMGEQLVESMTAKWSPNKYKDTYYDDLMKRIKAKVKAGGVISEEPEIEEPTPTKLLDLMPLLQKSLASAERSHRPKKTKVSRRRA